MDRADLERWMDGYRRAWETNDVDDVTALFTQDAVYRPRPTGDSWTGHDAIVEGWLKAKDDPGTWRFESHVLAIDGDLGFIQCVTTYEGEPTIVYDNLWVVRLADDGRCSDYTEWFVKRR